MKILITGGAGFIGSHIVEELLKDNKYELIIVDRLSTGSKENIPPHVTFYPVDITNNLEIEKVFRQEMPDYVIHQAAQVDVTTSIRDPLYDAKTNIIGTINLLMNCQKYSVKKIVYASSCAVYGEVTNGEILEDTSVSPLSFYGISKLTPELYIKLFHNIYALPYTILRYANVYGPRQSVKAEGGVVAIFINRFLKGQQPIIFGDGLQTRDFVYVKDVAKANMLALSIGDNEVLNIGSNIQTSINDLYALLSSFITLSPPAIYKPERNGDLRYSQLNNIKALQVLNWKPDTTFEEGLKETIAYYKND